MTIAYITIGNSDDKLPQKRWAEFVSTVGVAVVNAASMPGARVHGAWVSRSAAAQQEACWALELPTAPAHVEQIRAWLVGLARAYAQGSIVWAEAPTTEFLGGERSPT